MTDQRNRGMTDQWNRELPTVGDAARPPRGGLSTVVDGLSMKSWIAVAATIAVVVLGFSAWWTYGLDRAASSMGGGQTDSGGMGGTATDVPRLPPVAAYYDGQQVHFAHPETSDPEFAETLTDMMDSPVITVPTLARTPETALGSLYVFTNGLTPKGLRGLLGFHPDVFDSAPGDPQYSPLRRVVRVTWTDDARPRLLASSDEVEQAIDTGELSVERTDIVLNAPLLTWPGGQR